MEEKRDNKTNNNEGAVDLRIFTQIAEELKKETENIGKPLESVRPSKLPKEPKDYNENKQKKPVVGQNSIKQLIQPNIHTSNVSSNFKVHNIHKHIKKKEGKYHLDLKNIFAGFHQQASDNRLLKKQENVNDKTIKEEPPKKTKLRLTNAYPNSELEEKPEISVELDIIKSVEDKDKDIKESQLKKEPNKKDHYIQDIIEEVKKTESTLVKPEEIKEQPIKKTQIKEKTNQTKEEININQKIDPRYEVISLPEVITYANIPKKSIKPIKNIFNNIELERLNKEIKELKKQKHKRIKQIEPAKATKENSSQIFISKPVKEYKLPDLFSKELSFKVDISKSRGFEQENIKEDKTENNSIIESEPIVEPLPVKMFTKNKKLEKQEEPIVKTVRLVSSREKIPHEAYLKKPDVEQISKSIEEITQILVNRNKNLSGSFRINKNSYEENQERLNVSSEEIKNNILIMNKDFSWPQEI